MSLPDRALLVVDVQNDFCEGGSLAVTGGAAVATKISEWIRQRGSDYALVVASRDWHRPDSDNGGHFAAVPDYAATWPAHCVEGTTGADYHPNLQTAGIGVHVRKGFGRPAYSMFEAVDDAGNRLPDVLAGITAVDVVGIATDYCVLQTALGALDAGLDVRLLADLTAAVAPATATRALETLSARGAEIARA